MTAETSHSEYWASTAAATGDRYDAWIDKLNESFGTWRPRAALRTPFRAELRRTSMPSLSVIECRCEPCAGHRSRADALNSGTEKLTIQLVTAGRESITHGAQEAKLGPGDIFVWDDTQPMSFEVLQPLHKICVLIPLQRVRDWLQGGWSTRPRWLKRGEPGTEILASFVQGVSRLDCRIGEMRQNALVEAAVAMLVASLPDQSLAVSVKSAQLEIVKSKILKKLADPNLDLDGIARSSRISVRHLHRLFEADGCTPWRFVTRQRLEACYRDLVNPALRSRKVTDIAFAWGFSNIAHFSRTMKLEYGVTPSELRARAFDGSAA